MNRQNQTRLLHALNFTLCLLILSVVIPQLLLGQDLHDGPHVFWLKDRAVAVSVVDSERVTQTFRGKEFTLPVRLNGIEKTLTLRRNPPKPERITFDGAAKICAISDVHGEFGKMVRLLQANGIIDETLRWTWGDGHLVSVGDLFDRGVGVTESLWLLRSLEDEARAADGHVHVVLGNHDIWNLRGEVKNVHQKYRNVARLLKIKVQDQLGPESELGRWLRAKNTVIRVNDILFVHGGISPVFPNRGTIDARDYAIRLDEELALFYGYEGPFWYRGYLMEWKGIPMASEDDVQTVLDAYNAQVIAVGHTIVKGINALQNGRVLAIETGMHKDSEGEALIWEDGTFYQADAQGNRAVIQK